MSRRKMQIAIIAGLVVFSGLNILQTVKADEAPEIEWSRTFGGPEFERGNFVQQTNDGGYIITGDTESYDAGSRDVWLIKTDSFGNEHWNRTFGGSGEDCGRSVQQTSDGGYIIVGRTKFYGHSADDVWLIKTDASGNEQWNKSYGGEQSDQGLFVQQTQDGGFILTADTKSYSVGPDNCWLIKTDENGNEEWNRVFGGTGIDHGYCVRQTSDGGYIIAGHTESFGMVGQFKGNVWLIKTDASGNELWNKSIGGPNDASEPYDGGAFSVQQTSDGGYILAGYENKVHTVPSTMDVWLIKTDSNGNIIWDQIFGGGNTDYAMEGNPTIDGGFIITGFTKSFGAGNGDFWLIKTDTDGQEQWNQTFGGPSEDHGGSVQQTDDDGYIIAGYTGSYGAGDKDVWLIKLKGESDGETIRARITGVEFTGYESYDGSTYCYKGDDTVSVKVWVENTGNVDHMFWVGFTVRNHDDTNYLKDIDPEYIELSPNNEGYVTLNWLMPDDAPYGKYDATIAVWESYSGGMMHGELDRWGWNNNIFEIGNQLYGYVKNVSDYPIEGIEVKVSWGLWDSKTDNTDENGLYEFSGLPTGGTVTIEASLTDGEYIKILDAQNNDELIRKEIGNNQLSNSGWTKISDIEFDSGHEDEGAIVFYYTQEAVKFYTTNLGVTLGSNVPLPVILFSYTGDTAYYNPQELRIMVSDSVSESPSGWEFLFWHEFSHYIMHKVYDFFPPEPKHGTWNILTEQYDVIDLNGDGGFNDKGEYDKNHGGYENHCTADSWVEGFARFMPCVIASELGRNDVDNYDSKLQWGDLEIEWQDDGIDEIMAVAAILWDLYDGEETKDKPYGSGNYDDDDVHLSIDEIWEIFSSLHFISGYYGEQTSDRYIYYVKDLYDVFSSYDVNGDGVVTSQDEGLTNDIFTAHGIPEGFTDPDRMDTDDPYIRV